MTAETAAVGAGVPMAAISAWALVVSGATAILGQGVLGQLLGVLSLDGRLSVGGIGWVVGAEVLATTLVTAAGDLVFTRIRLKTAIPLSAIGLCLTNVLTPQVNGDLALALLRIVSGVFEGVLFAAMIGMIARDRAPARWASILVAAASLFALVVTMLLTALVLPRGGADGGFHLLAVMSLAPVLLCAVLPERLAPLDHPGDMLKLPLAGWASLLVGLVYTASYVGFLMYVVPLATAAGLGTLVAGEAMTALLAAQVVGSLLALSVAHRARYLPVFVLSAAAFACTWPVLGFRPQAWLFITIYLVLGGVSFFSTPFLFPLAVDADSSRRSALQCGPAQLLGVAFGPAVASLAMSMGGPRGLVGVSLAMLALSLVVTWRVWRSAHGKPAPGAAA